jgi:hypothetical protein
VLYKEKPSCCQTITGQAEEIKYLEIFCRVLMKSTYLSEDDIGFILFSTPGWSFTRPN